MFHTIAFPFVTVCPRSHVHFYEATRWIEIGKTSWTHSIVIYRVDFWIEILAPVVWCWPRKVLRILSIAINFGTLSTERFIYHRKSVLHLRKRMCHARRCSTDVC